MTKEKLKEAKSIQSQIENITKSLEASNKYKICIVCGSITRDYNHLTVSENDIYTKTEYNNALYGEQLSILNKFSEEVSRKYRKQMSKKLESLKSQFKNL